MWNRAELKARGKAAFKKNYWICVLVSLILALIGGSSSSSTSNAASDDSGYYSEYSYDSFDINDLTSGNYDIADLAVSMVTTAFAVITIFLAIIMIVLGIFIFNPLEIGGCRFFIVNTYGNPGVKELLLAFKSGHYGNMVLTMFLKNLFTGLWSLLIIVPGIIKSYEYRMIPYLLADCPDMSRQDAFAISKEMMYGNKWNVFVFDLSFIGWNILSKITFGIVGLFWSCPYQNASNAELFLTLKDQYFRKHETEQAVY